jgi:hypothetical protein
MHEVNFAILRYLGRIKVTGIYTDEKIKDNRYISTKGTKTRHDNTDIKEGPPTHVGNSSFFSLILSFFLLSFF